MTPAVCLPLAAATIRVTITLGLTLLNRLCQSGLADTFEFLQSLLEDYTRRDISIATDRSVAVKLEEVICGVHATNYHATRKFTKCFLPLNTLY